MKRYVILASLSVATFFASGSEGAELFRWEPRLGVSAAVGVWSPGGTDQDLFSASMGGGLSILYWYTQRSQIQVRGTYAPLAARQEFWGEPYSQGQAFDVWEVKGSLVTFSAELRRLLPTDRENYIYIGVGASLYYFGSVKGDYEIYTAEGITRGTTSDERDPSLAAGAHLMPGMFFVFHPRVFIDVGVRFHFMYDGDSNPHWLEPSFGVCYRIF